MQGGYLAMLDVLGFSALVRGDQSAQRFHDYLDCVRSATVDTGVKYVVFSDTIILTTDGDSEESLLTLAKACSRLFFDLLHVHIAIRGAIAFGDFFRSTVAESVFVAGSAVIDAHWFEQQQDWVGIMLAPSARAHVPVLDERTALNFRTPEEFHKRVEWAAVIQRCQTIPFHATPSEPRHYFDGFAIVPRKCKLDAADLFASIKDAEGRLEWLRGIAPSPASQHKYQAAGEWLSTVRDKWKPIADQRERGHLKT